MTTIVAAICLFSYILLPQTAKAAASSALLLSRLDFAPQLLEMISAELTRKTGQNFSLTVQSLETFSASTTADFSEFMLVEKGLSPAILPTNFQQTGVCVRLVWVLATARQLETKINGKDLTLKQFVEILTDLRQHDPDRFPWFEPLLSRNSIRNLCLLLGEKETGRASARRRITDISAQNSAAAILYRAIESELLNPLSVEADLSLAMEVFAAGDAMFASHWVTSSLFTGNASSPAWLNDAILLPFPSREKKSVVPVMTLEVWKSANVATQWQVTPESLIESELITTYELDFASETAWIEKNHAENYDALVVGDL